MLDLKITAPCYIYDGQMIQSACRELKSSLPGFEFLYSVKANPFEPVVRCIISQGFGVDAASLREVKESVACGISPSDIFYSAPGKRESDLRGTWGKCTIIADSLNEIRLMERIAAESQEDVAIGLRLHPGFSMNGDIAVSSKFGIDLEDMQALKDTLKSCPHVRPIGIHVHLKSQVLDVEKLSRYYERVMETALALRDALDIEMRFINFGSGIGTVYDTAKDKPIDLAALNRAVQKIHEANQHLHARLLIETGRFIVCRAGKYVTPVVDKKTSHGVTYLIVANGLNGFMRPAIAAMLGKVADGRELSAMEPIFTQEKEFDVRIINGSAEQEIVTVVGSLCTAMDVIAENVCLNKAEIGDLLEISNAGSYAYTLSPLLFASGDLPKQYLLP